MNVVDSCGWLEYFADGPNADFFAPAIEATEGLLVPTLTLFEVFKRILQQRSEADALRAIGLMRQGFLGFGWLALSGLRYVIWFMFIMAVLTGPLLSELWRSRRPEAAPRETNRHSTTFWPD